MTSKIVVNNIESDSGISSITFNSNITGKDSTQNISGINSVTATTYYGDGSQLTGIDASTLKNGSDIKVQANSHGAVVTGILTANSLSTTNGTTSINKHSVGIGTTTTAGRNAGVSTATGALHFNTSLKQLEYYSGNKWIQITDSNFTVEGGTQSTYGSYTLFTFTSSGTLTVGGSDDIDIFLVGGGGQGGLPSGSSNYGGGGGAGGLVWVTGYKVPAGSHSIVVGLGGAKTQTGSGNRQGNDGQDSTAFGLTAKGGGGGGGQGGTANGRPGGSGGGAGYTGGNSGGAAATQPGQSNGGVGTLVYNLGNNGSNANTNPNGGGGGGGAGGAGFSSGASTNGGAGFNMSSLLGTAVGDSGWFAGGGGGTNYNSGTYAGSNGGNGGGGNGSYYNSTFSPTAGQANTGGGGGAGRNGGFGATDSGDGEAGGSGVVIIRVLTSLLS